MLFDNLDESLRLTEAPTVSLSDADRLNPDEISLKDIAKKAYEKDESDKAAKAAEEQKGLLKVEAEDKLQDIESLGVDDINSWFEVLVPDSGAANTKAGEIVRATAKIIYRWFNDGDFFYDGYGVETCGPAAAYLMENTDDDIASFIEGMIENRDNETGYEADIKELEERIIELLKTNPELVAEPNNDDMYDYELDESDIPRYDYEIPVSEDIKTLSRERIIGANEIRDYLDERFRYDRVFDGYELNFWSYDEPYFTISNITRDALNTLQEWFKDEASIKWFWQDLVEEYEDELDDYDDEYDEDEEDEVDELEEGLKTDADNFEGTGMSEKDINDLSQEELEDIGAFDNLYVNENLNESSYDKIWVNNFVRVMIDHGLDDIKIKKILQDSGLSEAEADEELKIARESDNKEENLNENHSKRDELVDKAVELHNEIYTYDDLYADDEEEYLRELRKDISTLYDELIKEEQENIASGMYNEEEMKKINEYISILEQIRDAGLTESTNIDREGESLSEDQDEEKFYYVHSDNDEQHISRRFDDKEDAIQHAKASASEDDTVWVDEVFIDANGDEQVEKIWISEEGLEESLGGQYDVNVLDGGKETKIKSFNDKQEALIFAKKKSKNDGSVLYTVTKDGIEFASYLYGEKEAIDDDVSESYKRRYLSTEE